MIQPEKFLKSSSGSNKSDLKPKYKESQPYQDQMKLIKNVANDFKKDSKELGIVENEQQAGGDRI